MKVVTDLDSANIILVRHGQSLSNAGIKTVDDQSIELTNLGLEQASNAANKLMQIEPSPSKIISSPFRRAVQTAQAYANLVNQTIHIDDHWHEIHYLSSYVANGTTYEERSLYRQEFWHQSSINPRYVMDGQSDSIDLDSVSSFIDRIKSGLNSLSTAKDESSHKIIVFTHEFVISTVIDVANGLDEKELTRRMIEQAGPAHHVDNCQLVGIFI